MIISQLILVANCLKSYLLNVVSQNNINLNIKDNKNEDALSFARRKGNDLVVDVIQAHLEKGMLDKVIDNNSDIVNSGLNF